MNKNKLIFEMFKNENFKCKHELEEKITKKINNLNDNDLKDISIRIINYQIDKYGSTLYLNDFLTKEEIERKNNKARNRNNKKRKKYQ